jgi:hypothetical protein
VGWDVGLDVAVAVCRGVYLGWTGAEVGVDMGVALVLND